MTLGYLQHSGGSGDAVHLFVSLGKKFETIKLQGSELEPETDFEDGVLTETVRGDVDRKLSDVFDQMKTSQ